jgi:CRISPR-associated protein Cas1
MMQTMAILSDCDFARDLNCCYLKESGRKVVLKEWDARLQTTIEHRRLHHKVEILIEPVWN